MKLEHLVTSNSSMVVGSTSRLAGGEERRGEEKLGMGRYVRLGANDTSSFCFYIFDMDDRYCFPLI